jgi:hypothetical protein
MWFRRAEHHGRCPLTTPRNLHASEPVAGHVLVGGSAPEGISSRWERAARGEVIICLKDEGPHERSQVWAAHLA